MTSVRFRLEQLESPFNFKTFRVVLWVPKKGPKIDENSTLFWSRFSLQIRDGLQRRLTIRQPLWEVLAVHDGNSGAVRLTQLGGVVGVTQQAAVVSQNERGRHIQKLL